MIALDASVLVAHFAPRDAHHEAATRLLRSAGDQMLIAHSLTVAEILVGGVKIGCGEQMLADIEAVGVQLATPTPGEPMRLANLRATTGLKLPDCCVLDTARSNTAALATFDAALARAAGLYDVPLAPN
ncbi:MAG: type II toxin-antitoxin system VapC family toxin [Mycobacteriales bacterium]